jgi:hypothetical protein
VDLVQDDHACGRQLPAQDGLAMLGYVPTQVEDDLSGYGFLSSPKAVGE